MDIHKILFATELHPSHSRATPCSITLASTSESLEIHQCWGIKNHRRRKPSFYQRISSLEPATRCPCPLHFDKKLCLRRMDSTSHHVLLNGYLENVCATPMPEAKRWGWRLRRKPIQVPPITLAIATCHMEQIEFVFLRWLVGALNSVLVALLIKAVKANLFSCEPGRLTSASRWHYIHFYTPLSFHQKKEKAGSYCHCLYLLTVFISPKEKHWFGH